MEEAERLCDRVAIVERGRVIDIGTPEGLVKRHCPEQTVLLSTDDPAAATHFASIPAIDSVQQQGRRWTLCGRSDDLVTDIIRCISEHRMRVTDFRTELATLEDVFLKLTGHSIRD
jgi:ABC-2 type transport system ATP-binding protein